MDLNRRIQKLESQSDLNHDVEIDDAWLEQFARLLALARNDGEAREEHRQAARDTYAYFGRIPTLADLRKKAFEERQASAGGSTDATSEAQR